jgi:hypothetical protein
MRRKTRNKAKNIDINCIGLQGAPTFAKDKGLIEKLIAIFEPILQNMRFYFLDLPNTILTFEQE